MWAIGGAYAFKATDKLTITPGVSYYVDAFDGGADAWEASLYAEYAVASGLTASINVEYGDTNVAGEDGDWNGFCSPDPFVLIRSPDRIREARPCAGLFCFRQRRRF
jgi:hypothetical protein